MKAITLLCTHTKISIPTKEHCPYCQTWSRLCYVLGLLCFIWHRVSWIRSWYNEIARLSSTKHLMAKSKTSFDSFEVVNPDINPIEYLWKDLEHVIWRKPPSKNWKLKHVAHEEWVKIPAEGQKSLNITLIGVIISEGWATKY